MKLIECPKCKKELKRVRVYSECYQWGNLEGKTISDYGCVEEITETIAIECEFCTYDFFKNGGLDY